MTDPATPAPPPAAAVSAIARDVRRHRIMRTRRAPRRAGGRMAARLTARERNARGDPSFNVEAPSRAVRAMAGFGSFGAPFGLVPTLAAAAAFARPESAGAAGAQGASHSPASRWSPIHFKNSEYHRQSFPNPFKELQERFKPLPNASKSFKKFQKLSGPRRRGGMAGRLRDGLGGASRLCSIAIAAGALGAPRAKGRSGVARLSKRARG